jgi:hypothetical protein
MNKSAVGEGMTRLLNGYDAPLLAVIDLEGR